MLSQPELSPTSRKEANHKQAKVIKHLVRSQQANELPGWATLMLITPCDHRAHMSEIAFWSSGYAFGFWLGQ